MSAFRQKTKEYILKQANVLLPVGLHSFAWGYYKKQMFIVGGRTNGLHGFSKDTFSKTAQNTSVYVIRFTDNEKDISIRVRSLNETGLTVAQLEFLSATNQQFYQTGKHLYVLGGYGYDSVQLTWTTKPRLACLNLSKWIRWVQNPSTTIITSNPSIITSNSTPTMVHSDLIKIKSNISNIRNISNISKYYLENVNDYFAVTGGALDQIGNTSLLVFGQNCRGEYGSLDFQQIYTKEVRRFYIYSPAAKDKFKTHNCLRTLFLQGSCSEQYRRRDFNLLRVQLKKKHDFLKFLQLQTHELKKYPLLIKKVIQKKNVQDGQGLELETEFLVQLSGVFTLTEAPWLNPIIITERKEYILSGFEQEMNNYSCANILRSAVRFHNAGWKIKIFLFGGMGLVYYDDNGQKIKDSSVPFSNQCSSITLLCDMFGNVKIKHVPLKQSFFAEKIKRKTMSTTTLANYYYGTNAVCLKYSKNSIFIIGGLVSTERSTTLRSQTWAATTIFNWKLQRKTKINSKSEKPKSNSTIKTQKF
jgi:hypothetical protein